MSSVITPAEAAAQGALGLRGPADRAGGLRLRGGSHGLQRDDRQAAGVDRPLREPGRCFEGNRIRARSRPADCDSWRRPQRRRAGHVRRRSGHRPLVAEGHPGRPGRPHSSRRRRVHLGRGRPGDRRTRIGDAERDHLDHRGRRAHARRGLGHLTRKFGLAIDNLIEAELVLASGERVRANAQEDPDLYWVVFLAACLGFSCVLLPAIISALIVLVYARRMRRMVPRRSALSSPFFTPAFLLAPCHSTPIAEPPSISPRYQRGRHYRSFRTGQRRGDRGQAATMIVKAAKVASRRSRYAWPR